VKNLVVSVGFRPILPGQDSIVVGENKGSYYIVKPEIFTASSPVLTESLSTLTIYNDRHKISLLGPPKGVKLVGPRASGVTSPSPPRPDG
jgi:hypothetical protein